MHHQRITAFRRNMISSTGHLAAIFTRIQLQQDFVWWRSHCCRRTTMEHDSNFTPTVNGHQCSIVVRVSTVQLIPRHGYCLISTSSWKDSTCLLMHMSDTATNGLGARARKYLYSSQTQRLWKASSLNSNTMSRFLLLFYFAISLICAANAANYCGSSRLDAAKCRNRCPSGRDFECPPNESCYSDVQCASASTVSRFASRLFFRPKPGRVNRPKNRKNDNRSGRPRGSRGGIRSKYCGTSREDATKCRKRCLFGFDFQCPGNEKCFSDVQCASNSTMRRR